MKSHKKNILLAKINDEIHGFSKPCVVAISGFGGSGKSTLAEKLGQDLRADVVCIDSFTIDRTQTNYHHWENHDFDRLLREVIRPFRAGLIPFSYGLFHWGHNCVTEEKTIENHQILIVEGVGLFRPELNGFLDYRIWVDCPIEESIRRGKKRDREVHQNPQDEMWEGVWKRNDLEYYDKFKPHECANVIYNSSNEHDSKLELENILVRPACSGDAREICKIVRRSIIECCQADHRNDPSKLEVWLSNKTEDNMVRLILDASVSLLVGEINGQVVGTAKLSQEGKVTLFFISPDHLKRGVGKCLMRAIEDIAKSRGIRRLELNSTRDAVTFYERQGFDHTGNPILWNGMTCYPMTKKCELVKTFNQSDNDKNREQLKLAQKIAGLDEINMSEVLQKVGASFDREQRTQQVLSLFGWGAKFVTEYHGDHLVGYLQYMQFPSEALQKLDFPEGTVEIGSLQVHPEYRQGNVLRRLFRQTFMMLSGQNVQVIRSTVQLSNDHSIRFHLRLGFREYSRNSRMIDFRADAKGLMDRFYRYSSF